MKFHGIDVKGKLWVHRVADSDTETHTSVDEGRLIYSEDDERLYVGTSSDWLLITTPYDVISSGTKLLFGYWPFPSGWTLDTTHDDSLALFTDTSSEIGNDGGSWTITGMNSDGSHNHSMSQANYRKDFDPHSSGSYAARDYHTHTIYSNGSHTHTFDGTWRPAYVKFAIAVYT